MFEYQPKFHIMPPQEDIERAAQTFVPGVRVRHVRGGWTGVVVERPADASPGVHESSIWILADGSERGPQSWSPHAMVGAVDLYDGPVNDSFTRRVEAMVRDHKAAGLL